LPFLGSFEDIDLADLLAALGRGRGGTGRAAMPVKGRDFETGITLTLADARQGTTVKLNLQDGAGERVLEVTVPPGTRQDQKLRLRGKGGKGQHGGPDGDIYLHITLAPHPVFRPDGLDLYFDLALTPWEAALGAGVEVPTLDGPVLLTIPAGTRSGRKLRLRLRGRGLLANQSDIYAIVHIDVPTSLTESERVLYQELARISHFNPRATTPKENPT